MHRDTLVVFVIVRRSAAGVSSITHRSPARRAHCSRSDTLRPEGASVLSLRPEGPVFLIHQEQCSRPVTS